MYVIITIKLSLETTVFIVWGILRIFPLFDTCCGLKDNELCKYNPQLVRVVDPQFSRGSLLLSDDTFASDRRTVVIITATVTINILKVSAGLMLTKHICSRFNKKKRRALVFLSKYFVDNINK